MSNAISSAVGPCTDTTVGKLLVLALYCTGCSCHGSAKYAPANIFMTGIPKTVLAGQTIPCSITVTATGGKKFGMNT